MSISTASTTTSSSISPSISPSIFTPTRPSFIQRLPKSVASILLAPVVTPVASTVAGLVGGGVNEAINGWQAFSLPGAIVGLVGGAVKGAVEGAVIGTGMGMYTSGRKITKGTANIFGRQVSEQSLLKRAIKDEIERLCNKESVSNLGLDFSNLNSVPIIPSFFSDLDLEKIYSQIKEGKTIDNMTFYYKPPLENHFFFNNHKSEFKNTINQNLDKIAKRLANNKEADIEPAKQYIKEKLGIE